MADPLTIWLSARLQLNGQSVSLCTTNVLCGVGRRFPPKTSPAFRDDTDVAPSGLVLRRLASAMT